MACCWVWQGQFGYQGGDWWWIQEFVLYRRSLNWSRLGVLQRRWFKNRDWPKNVVKEAVKYNFAGKEVGYAGAISGVIYSQHFHILGVKDLDYTVTLMAAYGSLEISFNEVKRRVNEDTMRFNYPEVFWNHYKYRHAVDNHNNHQQSHVNIDKTWSTSYWPNRIILFLTGVTEVKLLLALTNIYGHEPMENLEFWKNVSKKLLNNTYQLAEGGKWTNQSICWSWAHIPASRGDISSAQMVKCKTLYTKRACIGC